jgi:hypothetical protein
MAARPRVIIVSPSLRPVIGYFGCTPILASDGVPGKSLDELLEHWVQTLMDAMRRR